MSGLAGLQSEVRGHAVQSRDPNDVLTEIRSDRMRQTLEASITAPPAAAPRSQAPKGLELRYYFSPSCAHCAAMTPDIETLEHRYGSALTIVGIPIQLEGESITPQALRAYRQRFAVTFPFEERHAEIAGAVTEDHLEAVPLAVVLVHDTPNGPVHVPLTGARTTSEIEHALLRILDTLVPTRSAREAAPPTPTAVMHHSAEPLRPIAAAPGGG